MEKYPISIIEAIPNTKIREIMLKNLIGFRHDTDIFENGNTKKEYINKDLIPIIENVKKIAQEIL